MISGKIMCAQFGPDASYLAVGAMDRNLRIFGLPGSGGEEQQGDEQDGQKNMEE